MKKQMTFSETFFKAADILEKSGWCRFSMERDGEKFCAVGAIRKAFVGKADYLSEKQIQDINPIVFFANQNIGPYSSLMCFNDRIARDKRTVQRKLRSLGRLAQKQGK
jgi:hypothetical protein